jgi:hypothetical protein
MLMLSMFIGLAVGGGFWVLARQALLIYCEAAQENEGKVFEAGRAPSMACASVLSMYCLPKAHKWADEGMIIISCALSFLSRIFLKLFLMQHKHNN